MIFPNKLKCISLLCALIFLIQVDGSAQKISHIEPPNWWVGMNCTELEIMVHGENLSLLQPSISSEKVSLQSVQKTNNPNYIWLTIQINENATPGQFVIEWRKQGKKRIQTTSNYSLLERSSRKKGIDQSDLIYLIMPDRFSNGDENNDKVHGALDQSLNRDSMFHRHGGDLRGVINNINHLQDLGMSALWLNPVIENNEPKESYHGYAATDVYKVDPRLGTNADYQELIDQLHDNKMKIIQDVVYNHWGDQHWMYQDLPDSSFINFWSDFQRTSYRATTLFDPYSAETDKKIMTDGWFDQHMPDLNQKNPLLANYLIQNSIWWVEQFNIDALRIDTYAYSDQMFMSDLSNRLLLEFPDLNLFGETWVHGSSVQNWFTEGAHLGKGYSSGLQGVTDFQLYYAVNDAFRSPEGWAEGVNKIYYTLAKDYTYVSPESNVVFLDNHDLSRFYSMIDENLDKFKMGIGFIYTTRGIPCVYYGTEILMSNFADPDGKVRQDFPGGWPSDSLNHFMGVNLSDDSKEAYAFMKKLGEYRKSNPEVFQGDLLHFVPEKNIYVYFRESERKRIMVVMNFNSEEKSESLDRYAELLSGYSSVLNVISNSKMDLEENLLLAPLSITILELQP